MRTASLVGTAVSSTSANGRGTRDASFARSSFSSAPLFFFSLSRIERCACDCASLRVGREAASGSKKNRLWPRCASCERSRFDAMEFKRISTRNSLEFAFVSRSLDLGLHESRAGWVVFFSLCSSLLLPRKPITFCFIHFIYTIASRLVTHPHSFSFFSHFHARKQQFKDNPRRGKR